METILEQTICAKHTVNAQYKLRRIMTEHEKVKYKSIRPSRIHRFESLKQYCNTPEFIAILEQNVKNYQEVKSNIAVIRNEVKK